VVSLVPQALSLFRSISPGVSLSLVEGMTPTLLERLASGDADIAVVSSTPTDLIDSDHFDLHPLVDERLFVAVARTHPLARRRVVRLIELADDPFVVGSATVEETLLRASLRADFQPRIDIVAADWTGKFGCVSAGLGVALVPALATRGVPADIALLRLHADDESIRRVFAATVAGRSRPPAVSGFLPHLDQVAKQFSASSWGR
jgi:DNA-binding transcriptional LysR family regulator